MRYILLLTVVLASNAFAAPDFDETMAEANQGAAYAQYNLGVMYDNGKVFQRTMLRLLSGTGKQLIKGMQRLSPT